MHLGVPAAHTTESELIGAALRYVAYADWFEARPFRRRHKTGEEAAVAQFDRLEAELRAAGQRLLAEIGSRELVQAQVVEEVVCA
jgi:hypothetical protein